MKYIFPFILLFIAGCGIEPIVHVETKEEPDYLIFVDLEEDDELYSTITNESGDVPSGIVHI